MASEEYLRRKEYFRRRYQTLKRNLQAYYATPERLAKHREQSKTYRERHKDKLLTKEAKYREYCREHYARRAALGLCRSCQAAVASSHTAYCPLHFCKKAASNAVGNSRMGAALLDLFERQAGICPYTGEKLVFGLNASIDHVLPQARFPDLVRDVTNLEWISLQVNYLKRDLTREELIALCRLVAERAGGLASAVAGEK